MRPPVDTILAPPLPRHLRRVPPGGAGAAQAPATARAQVVCFWDVCQPASLRALGYLVAWHERYGDAGLRVVAVHAPSTDAGRDEDLVADAAGELRLPFEVVLDTDFHLWRAYENPGWPARYVLAPGMRLVDVHFGEGGYADAERAIQELVGAPGPLLDPLRAADDEGALVVVPTADVAGAHAGPYAAGEVWVVVDGPGSVRVDGVPHALGRVGAHRVIAHEAHAHATVTIEAGDDVRVLQTAFAAGIAPDQ